MSDEESAGRVVSELLEKINRQAEELREARRLLKDCEPYVLYLGTEGRVLGRIREFLARTSRFEK